MREPSYVFLCSCDLGPLKLDLINARYGSDPAAPPGSWCFYTHKYNRCHKRLNGTLILDAKCKTLTIHRTTHFMLTILRTTRSTLTHDTLQTAVLSSPQLFFDAPPLPSLPTPLLFVFNTEDFSTLSAGVTEVAVRWLFPLRPPPADCIFFWYREVLKTVSFFVAQFSQFNRLRFLEVLEDASFLALLVVRSCTHP